MKAVTDQQPHLTTLLEHGLRAVARRRRLEAVLKAGLTVTLSAELARAFELGGAPMAARAAMLGALVSLALIARAHYRRAPPTASTVLRFYGERSGHGALFEAAGELCNRRRDDLATRLRQRSEFAATSLSPPPPLPGGHARTLLLGLASSAMLALPLLDPPASIRATRAVTHSSEGSLFELGILDGVAPSQQQAQITLAGRSPGDEPKSAARSAVTRSSTSPLGQPEATPGAAADLQQDQLRLRATAQLQTPAPTPLDGAGGDRASRGPAATGSDAPEVGVGKGRRALTMAPPTGGSSPIDGVNPADRDRPGTFEPDAGNTGTSDTAARRQGAQAGSLSWRARETLRSYIALRARPRR